MSERPGLRCEYKDAGPNPVDEPPCETTPQTGGWYQPCGNCTASPLHPQLPKQKEKLFHVVDYHPYPVGEPVWLGGKVNHIPWSQYSLTLCGMIMSESREEIERKSLTRQDKETCGTCESINRTVLIEYLDHKRSTRELP